MRGIGWSWPLALCLLWAGCAEEPTQGASGEDSATPSIGAPTMSDTSPGAPGSAEARRADCNTLVFENLQASTHPPAGVRVVFSASTCDGQPVPNLLTEGSFDILNDETGQPFGSEGDAAPTLGEATDFSFYTVVLIDLSYSVVNNGTLQDELDGAQKLIDRLVSEPSDPRRKHNVALYVFGSTAASELWQPFTKDATLLAARIDALRADEGRGSTNLYGAYMAGLDLVGTIGIGSDARVLRAMVLMTDGTHETGDADELRSQALNKRDSMQADIYAIGLEGDYDPSSLSELASGPTNFVLAEDSEAIITAFDGIAQSVEAWAKSNYVIGVCSPLEGPGRGLTFTAAVGGYQGGFAVSYDATGFNLVDCDPAQVANPCQDLECGAAQSVNCGFCIDGLVCVDNRCEDYLCVPDAEHCHQGDVYRCASDGEGRSLVETCGASSYCEEEEGQASCITQACAPDTSFCQGEQVFHCDPEGASAEVVQDCSAVGQICLDAACVEVSCTPDALSCSGQDIVQCDSAGDVTSVLLTCPPGQTCVINASGPVCGDCEPSCSGKSCGPDGCGSTCGACLGASLCNDAGQCVEPMPCAAGEVSNCEGGCSPDALLGNGNCDAVLDCALANFDEGDCAQGCLADADCSELLDGLECRIAQCDVASGICSVGVSPDATPCGEDDPCKIAGACAQGFCIGQPLTCDDGNPCTDGLCKPGVGCEFIPNTAPCDDGDPCTADDTCANAQCAGTPIAACAVGCTPGSEGDAAPVVSTQGGQVSIDWGESGSLSLYVTSPEAQLPLGPGLVNGGTTYWALAATNFPTPFYGPVSYGVVPPGASDVSASNGASIGGEALVPGGCYRFSVVVDLNYSHTTMIWPTLCAADEVEDCQGGCAPEADLGDGTCQPALDCAPLDFDGGDCEVSNPTEDCSATELEVCQGACVSASAFATMLANDTCDEALNCSTFDFDGGACVGESECAASEFVCASGQQCIATTLLCDGSQDCADGSDEADCEGPPGGCEAGKKLGCSGSCYTESWFGDGTCDSFLDCAETEWDGGDCAAPDPGDGQTSTCEAGKVLVCAGTYCLPESWLGDGTCDSPMDCAATGWDGGDCEASTGDGDGSLVCEEGEQSNCSGTYCYNSEWIADGTCDSFFNCAETGWDGGDCL